MSSLESDRWYYANTAEGFIRDAERKGYISDILEEGYKKEFHGHEPNIPLIRSWHASPPALAKALEKSHVTRDQIVVLEYRIDAHNRVDALICGFRSDEPNAVVVETKQWNEQHEIRSCEAEELIEMQFGNRWIQMEHPSIQAQRYRAKLAQLLNGEPHQKAIHLSAYAFLHNCWKLSGQQLSVLRGSKFRNIFKEVPIYTKGFLGALGNRIKEKTKNGRGDEVLEMLDIKL